MCKTPSKGAGKALSPAQVRALLIGARGTRNPKTFTYEPDGQRLTCEIRKHNSDSGTLKVVFSAGGHTNAVQQTSAEGGAITLRYEGNGGANLSLTTSGSGGQAQSTSQVSVSQSNSCSGGNNCPSQTRVSVSQSNSTSKGDSHEAAIRRHR